MNRITVGELPFIEKVKVNQQSFGNGVIDIAEEIGTLPHFLMIVMNNESGLNPAAKNPTSSATGLIQFMEDTARGMGTTTAALKQMSNVEQLKYVRKYLLPYKGKLNDVSDVYLSVFFPLALKKSEDYIFPKWASSANPIFDLNKDGQLTKKEFRNYVNNKYSKYIPVSTLASFKKKES